MRVRMTMEDVQECWAMLEAYERWARARWLLDRIDLPPLGTHPSPYLSAYYSYGGA